jgi:hypothetical protein
MKRSRAARPEPDQKPPSADILPQYPVAAELKAPGARIATTNLANRMENVSMSQAAWLKKR